MTVLSRVSSRTFSVQKITLFAKTDLLWQIKRPNQAASRV